MNHLLAALPDAEWQRWLPPLELVDWRADDDCIDSTAALDHPMKIL
jgi:hypothetical protein